MRQHLLTIRKSFDHCTQLLGALKQNIFSCITCNPPPEDPSAPYNPAGICYGCSIACHGEHTLVELFARRNFTCDCGTTRLPESTPCTLRIDPATGMKGPVHSQKPATGNTYNQNFRNRFCGCGEWYDPHKQKGTMYQCLGLATEQEAGCGEDWWHPECLLGLPHDWYKEGGIQAARQAPKMETQDSTLDGGATGAEEEHPTPPGFPNEDDFDTLICYKCVQANPWIRRYAGTQGFMRKAFQPGIAGKGVGSPASSAPVPTEPPADVPSDNPEASQVQQNKKRKADDDASESESIGSKRTKTEEGTAPASRPHHESLPPPPAGTFSILTENDGFRTRLCRCAQCYPDLAKHPQLLEEEETYEPPVSENGDAPGGSVGTGSLLERGEAALSNVERVRAIGKYMPRRGKIKAN